MKLVIVSDGKDHCLQALKLQSPLHGKGRFIVQQMGEEGLVLKDQSAGKENHTREFGGNLFAQFYYAGNDFRICYKTTVCPVTELSGIDLVTI